MEVQLNSKPEQLLNVFDLLRIPVLIVDRDGTVLSANSTAKSVLQYSGNDIKGRGIHEFMPLIGDFKESWEAPERSLLSGPVGDAGMSGLRFESTCRRKNGDEFLASVSLIPTGRNGLRLLVIEDISGQRRLQQRASQRKKELSAFNAFAKIVSSEKSRDKIIQESIDVFPSMIGAEAGWIHLYDEETGELCLKAHKGCHERFIEDLGTLQSGECLSGKVLASGRPLLVKKASEDPRITSINPSVMGFESIASAPLSSRGVVLGVLSIASRIPSCFTSMDMQLLSTLGSQLGAALDNAGLIEQLRDKMRQIELTNELTGTINSSLSIGTIFRIMVSEIRKFVEYSRASLLLYDEKNDNLVIFALDTRMKTAMPKGAKAPLEGTSAGWVFKHNRPWINFDLSAELKFKLDNKLLDEGIRSTVSIPLHQDKMLGVFNLDSTEPSKYSVKDLQTLLPVARHISIALENALLFEEISKEKKEWERTFDAITDMVWIKDFRQKVVRANKALLSKAGLSVAEVSGKQCTELLHRVGIDSPGGCLCSGTVENNKISFHEVLGGDGSIFHFWAYPLIDEEGQLYAIVHYVKDVTDRKRLEQQLMMADRLASLGTLAAGIAHEINNPLGIIAGYSEALLDRARNGALLGMGEFEDFPEYLETIHKEIFRCKEILASLLEFARPHKTKSRELDINELIKEVILLVNHKAKVQHHDIELKLNRDLPKICADPGSLRQLFMNIIINSMYFTPEGGGIEIKTCLNKSERRKGMIKITIRDTGPGIPRDIVDKIFDPFFTTKPIGEGSGLGLAICHKIAQEHGGFIDLKSDSGKGTAFIINLPAMGADDKTACS
jgi:two-component system NtrC family sensor kinase